MSDLPNGWEYTTVGKLLRVQYGKALPSVRRSDAAPIPVVASAGVMTFTDEPLATGPSVIIGRKGNVGSIQVFERDSWPIDTVFYSVIPDGIEPRFIQHYMQHQRLAQYDSSTSTPSLRREDLESVRLAIPPLAEQRRIVAALEDHLSRLDAGGHTLADVSSRLRQLERSAIDEVVIPRDPVNEDSESFSVIHNYPSKRIDYGALPKLPRSWKWRTAADVCESIFCGSTPESSLMRSGDGDVPFLKVYNLTHNGSVDFTVRPTFVASSTHIGKLRRSRARPGDVLTNIVGPPLGKTAIVPSSWPEWNMNQAIVAFRAGPEIHAGWLAVTLRSPFILDLLQSTARATAGQFNIALSTCRELPLPIPPLQQQPELVEVVQDQLRGIARLSGNLSIASRRSTALHRALFVEAFVGRIVPQDPADEPASVLLDRIRAERAAQPKSRRRRNVVEK